MTTRSVMTLYLDALKMSMTQTFLLGIVVRPTKCLKILSIQMRIFLVETKYMTMTLVMKLMMLLVLEEVNCVRKALETVPESQV